MTKTFMPIESELCLMTIDEKIALHNLISTLSNNSIIVEIGSYIGGSACLMASVNSTITVNCIDMHDPGNILQWNIKKQFLIGMLSNWYNLHNIPNKDRLDLVTDINNCFINDPTGKTALKYVTIKYSNIKLHDGISPDDFLNWDQAIDVCFEDATHCNPVLIANLNFWSKHIKPGGYLIGHDYEFKMYPDVVNEFDKLIQQGWIKVSLTNSLIILQKPNKEQN